jgi:hypothetical protein
MQRLIWLGVRSITGKNYKDVDWTSTAKEDDKLKVEDIRKHGVRRLKETNK